MSWNPPAAATDVLGLPIQVILLGIAIVEFVVGFVWLRRFTRVDEDSGDWWRAWR